MKSKILALGILMTFIAIVSCVKEETKNAPIESELNDEAVLKSLRSSSKKKRKLEAVPYVMEATCGVTETFELWYGQDFPYGTVTVYNNNEFLYIQYDVDKNLIDAGWGFHTTYLFVGDYSKLPYKEVETDEGKIITVIDWDDNIINRETYDDNPTSVVRSIALIELPECFGIASKAKLNNPFGGQNPNPRAMLNIEDYYKYPWLEGYEYCVQNCCVDSPGTGSQGYWRNHPDVWPVDEILIGNITYIKEDAIDLMDAPGKGDKTYDMIAQLVSAKLNVLIGNCSTCIDEVIAKADAWMGDHNVGSGVSAASADWKEGAGTWHTMLDDYNNGKLCAPHRD